MNMFRMLMNLTPERTPVTKEERTIVKMFGGSVMRVRYSGKSDLTGLMVLGQHAGIRIESTPSGRVIRKIDVVKGSAVPSSTTKKLRLDDKGRIHNFIPNNYVY